MVHLHLRTDDYVDHRKSSFIKAGICHHSIPRAGIRQTLNYNSFNKRIRDEGNMEAQVPLVRARCYDRKNKGHQT